MAKRPDPVIAQLRALRESGALATAMQLLDEPATANINLRVSPSMKRAMTAAAKRDKARSLKAWLMGLAQAAL